MLGPTINSMRSADRRQPTFALCVFLTWTSYKVDQHSGSIAKHFFKELSHFSDRVRGGQKLRKFQHEVEENVRAIAKEVLSHQGHPPELPEGFNIIEVVQAAAHKVGKVGKVNRKNRIWDLETVLTMDPKEAWLQFLQGKELSVEAEEEVAATRAEGVENPTSTGNLEATWPGEGAEPAPQTETQWDAFSESDQDDFPTDDALGRFVQRQLDAC
eukprot:Skav226505  [mRNA]  locus=scaffold2090:34367:35230:- [translate_table: standard]